MRESRDHEFLGRFVATSDPIFGPGNAVDTPSEIVLNDGWKYDAGGLRGGLKGTLDLIWGLSLRGAFNVSLLAGSMRVHYDHKGMVELEPTDPLTEELELLFMESYTAKGSESFTFFCPNIEALVGLDKKFTFHHRMLLNFFVGYEMSYWFNLGQFRRNLNRGGTFIEGDPAVGAQYSATNSKENSKSVQNIGLHGLTVRASFKY